MFSWSHFVWLGISALIIATLTFCSVKFKFSFKTVILSAIIIGILCILERILTGIIQIDPSRPEIGSVVKQSEIPLHLC